MPTIGTCALCCAPGVTLLGSHVVPEFLYKRVYTKSHKFTAISHDDDERLAVEQKGYRENLLCAACETKLSKWEGKLSEFVNQVASGTYTTCSVTQVGRVAIVSGFDYASIKLAVLSVFWRMGLARHKIFSAYELGPYHEKFRVLLDKQAVPPEVEYPILISRGLLNGAFLSGILFPVGRGRYDNDLIIQSVVLNGIVFEVFMTATRSIPSEVLNFSLRPVGEVLIADRPYEELGMDLSEFSKRMKATDVQQFYRKHAWT